MDNAPEILLTETARDAMQGFARMIPAMIKVRYINMLLRVGFHTVDCGSFVSAKAVPQMADTAEVLDLLDSTGISSKIMVVVGNVKGGLAAIAQDKVDILAFPYSISPTFLKINLNITPDLAWQTLLEINGMAESSKKGFRTYLAMAFGNPYRDDYSEKAVFQEVERMLKVGVSDIVFSDVTGEGSLATVGSLCKGLHSHFPTLKAGLHLHAKPELAQRNVMAAFDAGISRFEGAVGGIGGCPMSGYELLANTDSVQLIGWLEERGCRLGLDGSALREAGEMALELFAKG